MNTRESCANIVLLSSKMFFIGLVVGAFVAYTPSKTIAKDVKVVTSKENKNIVRMKVTAYCACKKCCGPKAMGITASGRKVTDAKCFVAADKNYKFGTMLVVPGYNGSKPVPVWDRGGAIKGNHIDVYFESHRAALNWGVKYLDVVVEE